MAASREQTIVCDLAGLRTADLATVGALARFALEARRLGLVLALSRVPPELVELIELAGLRDVLSAVEPSWEAEQREQPRGVEEERQLGDPAA